MSTGRWHFSPFTFDWQRDELLRDGERVRLRPKTLSLLRLLVSSAGRIVSRDEIMQSVWPDTAVSDVVVNVCVAELRRALGDDRARPRFLETVHRRGFRFLASVDAQTVPAPEQEKSEPEAADSPALIVGRSRELADLHRSWSRACGGKRQVMVVAGDAGIGKTALVERFVQEVIDLAGDASPLVARGQCLDLHAAPEPFLAVLEMLGAMCAGPFGPDVLACLRERAPALLLHVPTPLDPDEIRALRQRYGHRGEQAMVRELLRGLVAAATVAPLLLVLEDAHWSDRSTVDFVAGLARQEEGARLLLIVTMRPAEAILEGYPRRLLHLSWSERAGVLETSLELLDAAAVGEYLQRRFASSALADELGDWLVARTEGHPLFMVAVIDHLLTQGVLHLVDRRWTLVGTALPRELPPSLTKLLRGQVAGFDEHERDVLDAAAVAGQSFTAQLVAAGVERETEDAERLCQELAVKRHVLEDCGPVTWPDRSTGQAYRFRHAIYRQAIEAALPAARKRALHERIGRRLETGYGRSADEVAVELVDHFQAAGDDQRTYKFAKIASRRAAGRGGYRDAVDHMHVAHAAMLRLPPGYDRDVDELKLLAELSPLLLATGGLGDADAAVAVRRMNELAVRTDRQALHFTTLTTLTLTWRLRGEIAVADATGNEVLALAHEIGDPLLELIAYQLVGSTRFHAGDFAGARHHLEESVRIGDERDVEQNMMAVLSLVSARGHLGALSWVIGRPNEARRLADVGLAVAAKSSLSAASSMAHAITAWTFVVLQDFDKALELVNADAIVASNPPLPLWTATSAVIRGWCWVQRGRIAEGLAEVETGYQAYLDAQGEASVFDYQVLRAEALLLAGRVDEAAAMAEEAVDNLERYHQGYFAPELHRVRGEVCWARRTDAGREDARRCWREGLALAHDRGALSCELRLALVMARAEAELDRDHVDRSHLRSILARFDTEQESSDLAAARQLATES